jgi:AcrR family transcriptional regulator
MPRQLSTSDARRDLVIDSAIHVFAKSGYLGTPVTAVARHAQISPAYVFKLFPRKEELFVAALERAFLLIETALSDSVDGPTGGAADDPLAAMGASYARLISERSLLMLQVHAVSVADVPEIGKAFRSGLERIARLVKERSGASDEAVQRFFAYGQLCHLIAAVSLEESDSPWANMLTAGIKHA